VQELKEDKQSILDLAKQVKNTKGHSKIEEMMDETESWKSRAENYRRELRESKRHFKDKENELR
jgi:hypothetical protein